MNDKTQFLELLKIKNIDVVGNGDSECYCDIDTTNLEKYAFYMQEFDTDSFNWMTICEKCSILNFEWRCMRCFDKNGTDITGKFGEGYIVPILNSSQIIFDSIEDDVEELNLAELIRLRNLCCDLINEKQFLNKPL